MSAHQQLTDEQWEQYQNQGYLRLGRIIPMADIEALQQRIDEIMLGTASIDYDKVLMQLDSDSGDYDDLGAQSPGYKGKTLNYRKIQDLELDDLFMTYMRHPMFEDICRRAYGADADVDVFRAMFMNKPAGKGTYLPWHQDRWTMFDRDPQVTLWTALDPVSQENGCVQIIPESHHRLINPKHGSGFLEEGMIDAFNPDENRVHLELELGEVVLLHNWLLHASDKNNSDTSRRAFSVCYMDAQTQMHDQSDDYNFTRIFDAQEAVA